MELLLQSFTQIDHVCQSEGPLVDKQVYANSFKSIAFCKLGFFVTAPFNNKQTLKFKAQPTNAVFATTNQMFSDFSRLPTMLSECTQRFDLITGRSEVVGSCEKRF